jgi:opacity protein-like surface antigen
MDRFDDIWKNRFDEEEFSEGDWNTPDEKVWEGIVPHVAPKKYGRSFWMIWLGVGVVATLLCSILLLNKGDQTSPNAIAAFGTPTSESIESTHQTGVIGDNAMEQKLEPLNTNQIKTTNESLTINVSPKNNGKANSKVTYLKSNPEIVNVFKDISTGLISMEISPVRDVKSTLSISKKLENVILKDGMKDKNFEENLKSIPSLNMFLSNENEIHPIPILPEFEISQKGKLTFGVGIGTTFWQHRISNDYTADLAPFDFNYQDAWGWQTSFSLNVALNNYFDAFASLQFEQVKATSGHNSDLTYDILEEENPFDPLNDYALNLATPYGLSGATFNFNRGQTLASDEVNLLVDFNSEHLIRNFSLPLGVVIYPLGKKRKFSPTVNLGFGINYLAQISNKIQSIETHHDAIQYDDSGSSTFVSPDLEKWHFDYRLGLGLKYEVQQNLYLQLNYNWIRGLNPIYKLENYETRIDRHQISIGLTKLFTS